MTIPSEFDPAAVEAFHYDGWDADDGTIVLRYRRDGLAFEERFDLPDGADPSESGVARAVDVLHLAAGTSYYKAAAPPVVSGVPTWATSFVEALYLDGLAEFA